MNENVMENQIDELSSPAIPKAFQTIVYGGLTVGVIDGLAAITNAGIRSGVTPDRVFQYIASGLLGRDVSYNGGAATVMLGILFHFAVAFGVATAFYVLSRNLPMLLRHPFIFGPLYGIAVYFAMGYLIVPLSAVPKLPFSVSGMITGIVIHMFCVGLPVALIARRSAAQNS